MDMHMSVPPFMGAELHTCGWFGMVVSCPVVKGRKSQPSHGRACGHGFRSMVACSGRGAVICVGTADPCMLHSRVTGAVYCMEGLPHTLVQANGFAAGRSFSLLRNEQR